MRVAINGIGVAGPTLAYWLREYGHEPVLFERSPTLRAGGYLIDFWGLGYEIADRMGLMPTLRAQAYEIERMRLVDAEGHDDASLDLRPMREILEGRFISLARADLAATLFRACAGIPAHFNRSITGLEQDGEGVIATVSDGEQERFEVVIGADGLHSHVRELCFGAEARFEQSLDCYVAAFRLRHYPHRNPLTYVSHTVPRRQVARVSLRDDETLVLLVGREELFGGFPAPDQQKAALYRAFGDMAWEVPEILERMEAVEDVYFDRVSQIHLPHWAVGRVGVVGDAAACPSLLAGEGTGLAMIEAYVLAGELHRADGDVARAFAAYDTMLRPFVTDKQKAALRFRDFFAPETALALKVRNLATHALSVPLLAKWFLARSLHDDFVLPRYGAV